MKHNALVSINERKRDYRDRVRYAAAAMMRREDSRKFDNCFEMHDGAFVVVALMRQAENNQALRDAICDDFGKGWEELSWQKVYNKHKHLSDAALAEAAAHIQIESEWLFHHFYIKQMNADRAPDAQKFIVKRDEDGQVIKDDVYAPNLREALKIIRDWGHRTVMGLPYFSLLAHVTIAGPDGSEQPVSL